MSKEYLDKVSQEWLRTKNYLYGVNQKWLWYETILKELVKSTCESKEYSLYTS